MSLTQPTEHCDYLIVGGGASGLLLAERLSRDGEHRVTVLEAGKDLSDDPIVHNIADFMKIVGSEHDWHFETLPQAGLNGRSPAQASGKILGGSAAINGAYYVPPSKRGVDAWARLGSPSWTYEKLLPFCTRMTNYNPPSPAACEGAGMTAQPHLNGISAEERARQIDVTATLDESPITQGYYKAMKDFGLGSSSGLFHHYSAGGRLVALTQLPDSGKRSFFVPLPERPNLKVVTEATVRKILLSGSEPSVRATGVEFVHRGQTRQYVASKEVVLAAGALSSPKLLELSGIGSKAHLQTHGVAAVIDNPAVGENLRNHLMARASYELNAGVAQGRGMTAMSFLPVGDMQDQKLLFNQHVSAPGQEEYDDEVKHILSDAREGSAYHFMANFGQPNHTVLGVISAIPFSRGSVHMRSAEPDDMPMVDSGLLSDNLDLEILARHVQLMDSFPSAPGLQAFFKKGGNRSAKGLDDLDTAKEFVRDNSITLYHSCGSTAMLPRDKGGVVNERLMVYGTENLRIVDSGVIPVIPHGNPMSAVYAVAERAADIITGKA